jgi:hypothetical protein
MKKLPQQMKKQLFPLAVLGIIACTAIPAQAQKTEPVFEISAGNIIANTKFLVQASSGELISGNDLKLFAIDPEKKTVIWENNDFLGLSESDITVIDGTPFIKIERQKTLALSKNKNTYIIQARDGKVVYDSKDEGIKVRNTLIIPGLGGLLIESVKDGFLSVSLLDFASAKLLWTVPLAKEKTGGIGIGALKRAVKSHTNSAFNIAPIVDNNQNLVLVNKTFVYAIAKNGSLAWKKEYDDTVEDAYLGNDGNSLFIGYKSYIDKLNTATGNSLLAEPIKMRDALNSLVAKGDQYIVCNEAGVNIMDATGTMLWKKDSKLGNITQARYTPNGILAIEAVKDDETVFYWLDNEGKKIWDEKVDGGLMLAEPTDKGIMYVTTERANILTYEKGKDVWNRDIKLKGTPFFGVDAATKTLYALAGSKVHAFNFSDNSYKLLNEDLDLKKFDDEKETAILETRNNGSTLMVYTSQNVAALQTNDGKILYNNYFKDIGNSQKKLMRFAGAVLSTYGAAKQVSGLGNITAGTPGALSGNTSQMGKGMNQYESGAGINDAGNSLYSAASKRYLASQATKDNLYILSEMPEGNGMLVWDKIKGAISKKITFNDTTPQYVVDEAADMVYVVVGNTIKAYDLK